MTMSIATFRRQGHYSPATYCRTPSRRPQTSSLAGKLLDVLFSWQERANQRHALTQLDDRLLRDVGLDRVDVDREVAKPFWAP